MTAFEDREAAPPWREAPRELEALAIAMRPDWDQAATWDALFACHQAGWAWDRVLKRVTALLLREGSEPRELRDEARATRNQVAGQIDPDAKAAAFAKAAAHAEAFRARDRGGGT